ncbi:dihydroneopterin aldolase [Weissella oryzae SG25]|uniref:7,8-dihydroneopterin aldolase n=1 Tax=Weissella oryzae (strain DSM 25784 / JCM 18191 / LMG 30913 / SG25) TaxID=1329250 RepID=A0A069CT23_WEIOS|nr:dihydroneopterin aldolase [Weissella oryzae]GAK30619.1 dihydroneopterin aldolase [Weissella oryzae SG25]
MYKIKINKMQFHSHIGVLAEEKILGQQIEVDLQVETNFDFSGQDQLTESLSYVDFYTATKQIVDASRVDLIEKLAFDIIQTIKQQDPTRIAAVEVHVRKLAVPIDGIFANTEIEMRG